MNAAPLEQPIPDGVAPHCGAPATPLQPLRTLAKRILPRWAQSAIRAFIRIIRMADGPRWFYRDYRRYFKNSGILNQDQEVRLRALITASYHMIEKGLSHQNPRPGFGVDTASALARYLTTYRRAGYPASCSQYQSAIAVLTSYRELQHRDNTRVPLAVDQFLDELGPTPPSAFRGGYVIVRVDDLVASWRGDFRSLASHRHSIRHFAGTSVSEAAIERAVDLARCAPSACNRQPVCVHVIRNRRQLEQILELQGGARGFIELIDKVLIVTVDLRAYFSFAERNLAYVDGGLFAMTLMYALCYEGIGSCPLHMALSPGAEDKIRGLAGLSEPEATVVMLGVGNLPQALKVTHSQRKPLHEYLVLH